MVALPGIEVTTTITPTATGHCRHHEIDSSFDCEAYDCGFAVPNFAPGYAESVENDTAEAHCDTLRCTVRGRGEAVVIGCDPNTSLYFTNVHLPAVKYHIPKGHTGLTPRSLTKRTDAASFQKNSRFVRLFFLYPVL